MISDIKLIPESNLKAVLDTLPISYYLHSDDFTVKFSYSKTSSCNLTTREITLSSKQITENLVTSSSRKLSVEVILRSELYHELSHALLTPRELKLYNSDIVNIFEDERIESLLRGYYMRVDFRKYVMISNNYPEININVAKTPRDAFFCITRFREGPKEFTDSVHELILKYSGFVPRFTTTHIYANGERCLLDIAKDYVRDINKLYKDIEEWFKNKPQTESYQNRTTSSGEQMQESMNDSQNPQTNNPDNMEQQQLTDEEAEETQYGIQSFQNFLTEVLDGSDELKDIIMSFVERYKNQNKRNGSAIPTHHGRLDKRAIQHAQINHDYKYWIAKNRLGNARAYSKIHLNIFCDVSGSIRKSEEQINAILNSLISVEREYPDFSIDLITMSEGEWLEDKSERRINIAGGKRPVGNFLTENIYNIYYDVQLPNTNNFNIVLFDGLYINGPFINKEHKDAYVQKEAEKNLRVFDNNNTFVIADTDNEELCKKYLCNTHNYKITKEYTKELKQAIIDVLDTMLR